MKTPDVRQTSLNIAGSAIGIGLVVILGFMSWALVYRQVPAENETGLSILLGILSAQVSMVVGFYFGSSASTKKQAETIDKMADTAKTAAQTAQAASPTAVPDLVLDPGQTATVQADDSAPKS